MIRQVTASQRHGSVRSVQRAARIITALAEHPYPMGVIELAGHVRLSPASAHRLLATLMQLGWVEQNQRSGKYRLGLQMMAIGSTGLITSPVVQNARPFLTELATRTGYHTALSTLVGMRVVHLARAAGSESGTPDFEPGVSQPAHAMADGKLLLAYLPAEERAYLYEVDGLARYTPNTIVEPAALEQELALIRERSYAVDAFERFEHTRGVAVPILNLDGQPLMALLCIGDIGVGQEQQLARQMQATAAAISRHIALMGDMPKANTQFARYNLQ